MNRIIEVKLTLQPDGTIAVAATKEFAPEHGGGTETFVEQGGVSWHHALDVARGMVTWSPARRNQADWEEKAQ
jgi:hypothetical protein